MIRWKYFSVCLLCFAVLVYLQGANTSDLGEGSGGPGEGSGGSGEGSGGSGEGSGGSGEGSGDDSELICRQCIGMLEYCIDYNISTICEEGEICYADLSRTPDNIVVGMGCKSEQECDNRSTQCDAGTVNDTCNFCCDTDGCNIEFLPEPSTDIPTTGVETPTTTSAASPPLRCYQCVDSTVDECRNSTAQTCNSGEICFTVLTMQGYLVVDMGCQNAQDCYDEAAYNDSSCAAGVVESYCHYCCDAEGCNTDFLPKSTTTTSQPTTTLAPTVSTTNPPIQRNESLNCHWCLEGEPSRFCNTTASEEKCDDLDGVCYWKTWNVNGTILSQKGCMQREVCSNHTLGRDPDCDRNIVNSNCHWCCENADKCNYDRDEYWPSEPSCDFYGAEKCIHEYFRNSISDAMQDPTTGFAKFCRSISDVYRCISESAKFCCEDEKDKLKTTLEILLGQLDKECPVTCDEDGGFDCLQHLYTLIQDLILGRVNCNTTESTLEDVWRCLQTTVGSCDNNIRHAHNYTYHVLKREIEHICEDPPTPGPTAPPTESPDCRVSDAEECISHLSKQIGKALIGGITMREVCDLVEDTEICVMEAYEHCSDATKTLLQRSFDYTKSLVEEDCKELNKPVCDTTEARTCVLDLWRLIEEAKDMNQACLMIEKTIQCVINNTIGCTEQEKISMNSTLKDVLDLLDGNCEEDNFEFTCENITLVEGGKHGVIHYVVRKSPSELCPEEGCEVYIDVDVEQGDLEPLCRNGRSINQIVCVGDPFGEVENYCSHQLTEENYNQEKQIRLAAKLDFKYDGDQERDVTIRLRRVKDGESTWQTLHTCRVKVKDMDRPSSTCKSINDPHMTTFDGFHYNHFHEGHFVLYRHMTLPFEVEAIYQRCNDKATCNCGIAIKAGDNVFFIDRCRGKDDGKGKGKGKHKCKGKKYDCKPFLTTTFYVPDTITPGFRIFSKNDGQQFDVILPHGATVKVMTSGYNLNAWITPSAADWNNTRGLCGVYDGDIGNDLMLPNDKVYNGKGNIRRGQPTGFNTQWRQHKRDRIYKGVDCDVYNPDMYCDCYRSNNMTQAYCDPTAILELCEFDISTGPSCVSSCQKMEDGHYQSCRGCNVFATCSNGLIYDNRACPNDLKWDDNKKSCEYTSSTCPQRTDGGEVTYDLPRIIPKKEKCKNNAYSERKRRATEEEDDDYEFEEDWNDDGEDATIPDNNEDYEKANKSCQDKLSNSAVVDKCTKADGPAVNMEEDLNSCIEDIMITGTEEWIASSLEAIKEECTTVIKREPKFASDPEFIEIASDIDEVRCPNECSGNGTCEGGKCDCNDGYMGEDCSFDMNAAPEDVALEEDGLCDVITMQCESAKAMGDGFLPNMTYCHLQKVEVTSTGIQRLDDNIEVVKGIHISLNELSCSLPHTASYIIWISINMQEVTFTPEMLHVPHNPTCYNCVLDDDDIDGSYCVEKEESCIINGECFAEQDTDPSDLCNICLPDKSRSEWRNNDIEECHHIPVSTILAIVIPCVAVILILVGIGICLHCRSKRSAMHLKKQGVDVHRENPNYEEFFSEDYLDKNRKQRFIPNENYYSSGPQHGDDDLVQL